MKLTIEKKDLLKNIQFLNSIIPSKNAMPILTNYLIEADEIKNTLTITATDLEIIVIAEFEANILESGKVAVSAKNFNEIIHSFSDGQIHLFKEDELFRIHSANSDFHLLCADTSQYPLVPSQDLESALSINAELFKKTVQATSFAVSNEPNRIVFNGIYWKLDPEKHLMAATDGKKIAEHVVNQAVSIEETEETIIPTKGLQFLEKVINDDCLELSVKIEKNRIMFSYDNFTIFSHIIEGNYPDYTKAIPIGNDKVLIVSKNALKNAIKRVSLLAAEDTYRVRFEVNQDEIILSTNNRELGDAKDIINAVSYSGEPIVITFNFRYLTQILNAVETDNIKMVIGKEKEPIMIYNDGDIAPCNSRFLLMPLRVT